MGYLSRTRFGNALASIAEEMTTPLTMEARAFPKRRDNSPALGGDISEDIMID
jgi:hypothetical protein